MADISGTQICQDKIFSMIQTNILPGYEFLLAGQLSYKNKKIFIFTCVRSKEIEKLNIWSL